MCHSIFCLKLTVLTFSMDLPVSSVEHGAPDVIWLVLEIVEIISHISSLLFALMARSEISMA